METPPATSSYPASLEIDYPDRPLDRVSTLLRIFYAIPILVLIQLVAHGTFADTAADGTRTVVITSGGLLVLPVVLMLLCRRKYPTWWFDFNLQLTRFSTRVTAYMALLDDTYPSTDEEQSVHLNIDRPVDAEMSRGLPLIKWFLAIPHYFLLAILGIAVFFVVIFAWFTILFTGRYPRGAFDFVVGYHRWGLRVLAYSVLLTTDRYPPFSLER